MIQGSNFMNTPLDKGITPWQVSFMKNRTENMPHQLSAIAWHKKLVGTKPGTRAEAALETLEFQSYWITWDADDKWSLR